MAIHCLEQDIWMQRAAEALKDISDKDNLCAFNNDQSNICYICVLDQEHRWRVQR